MSYKGLEVQFSFSSDEDGTTMYIESLAKNIDATLDLAKEKLFRPAFLNDDFRRVKKQTLEGMEAMKKILNLLVFLILETSCMEKHPLGE